MDFDGIAYCAEALELRVGRRREHKDRGPQVSIACPLAVVNHGDSDDHNMSCSISIDAEGPSWAKCFSFNCNFKGSFARLIRSAISKRPNPERYAYLLKYLVENEVDGLEAQIRQMENRVEGHVDDRSNLPAPEQGRAMPVHDRDVLVESTLDPFSGMVPKYAIDRGISVEAAKAWELGYDQKHERLVFPVRRWDGALVGLTGRIVPSAAVRAEEEGYNVTKYHNYSGLNKQRYLYGTHLWEKGKPLVLVEGPIDCVRTWMALHERANVGATMGQGFSMEHRRLVKAGWPKEVYIFGDNDAAGRAMSEKVFDRLHGAVICNLMLCPVVTRHAVDEDTDAAYEYEVSLDPGAMTDEQIVEAFETARPIFDRIDWV